MHCNVIVIIIFIIITASVEHVTIPILTTTFPSMYFIVTTSTIQGCINFGLINLYLNDWKIKKPKKEHIITIIKAGSFDALMSLSFIYSANPSRTPIIFQSILLGLTIIPSVLMTRYILKKQVEYKKKFIIPSILCLIISIIIAIVPMISASQLSSRSYWIIGYIVAVFFLAISNIMQEKYAIDTNDSSLKNRMCLAFYTSLTQLIILICLCWIDQFLGYNTNSFAMYAESFFMFFSTFANWFTLELLIFDCLLLYFLTIWLNSMSTNYNMILTNLTNQSVAIFFSVFSSLNTGYKHPPYITIVCLLLNCLSVCLWVKGENNINDTYIDINTDIDDINTAIDVDILSTEKRETIEARMISQ
jgi:hypothetical protein